MTIPQKFSALIERLDRELDITEQEVTEGLNLVRQLLSRFPDNVILTQFFAYFNTILFFIVDSKRRIQETVDGILSTNVIDEEIQEAGEELGTLLGQILELKSKTSATKTRLENWQ